MSNKNHKSAAFVDQNEKRRDGKTVLKELSTNQIKSSSEVLPETGANVASHGVPES